MSSFVCPSPRYVSSPKLSFSLFLSVHRNIHGSMLLARAAPIPRTTEEYPFAVPLLARPLDRFVYPFPFFLKGERNGEIRYVSGHRRSTARPLKTGTIHVTNGYRAEFMVIPQEGEKRGKKESAFFVRFAGQQ